MMASTMLSNALRDFGAKPPPQARGPNIEARQAPPALSRAPFADADRRAAEIAEAVADAETRLAERLHAEHERQLDAEREAHQSELARLRDEFSSEAAREIAAKLDTLEERLVEVTSSVVARLLAVVMTEHVQKRSLEALARSIHDALADKEAVTIRVTGPVSLYESLQELLGPLAEKLMHVESTDVDLTVSFDERVYETRLAEWSEALSEAVA